MAKAQKHVAERMCSVCRRRFPQRELIRFVLRKDGTAQLDLKGKREGRGIYLCHDMACLESVLYPQKKRVIMPDADSLAILEGLHAQKQRDGAVSLNKKLKDVRNLLGMARRSQNLLLGYEAVVGALQKNNVELLVLAEDISENSLSKVAKILKEHPTQSISLFSKAQLGQIFNKASLALCAVIDQGFADAIKQALGCGTDQEDHIEREDERRFR